MPPAIPAHHTPSLPFVLAHPHDLLGNAATRSRLTAPPKTLLTHMTYLPFSPRRIALAASFASLALAASLAAAPKDKDKQPAESDEVVSLAEFNVTETSSNSYMAAESTTGTRVASKIQDLPFNVNVVTSEFIDDFAALEFMDQGGYTSSFSPSEVQGQYQLRGFAATAQLVDGFRRVGLIDKTNIDRIEVIKGPAASIYGQIQPGGIVNIITKKPKTKPQESLTIQTGSLGLLRSSASSTGPVGKSNTLFYRADLAYQERSYEQAFRSSTQYYGSVVLLYKPNSDTSATLKMDSIFRHEHRGAQLGTSRVVVTDPFRQPASNGTPRTYTSFGDLEYDLFTFNYMGPLEFNDRKMSSLTASLEHRINSVWALRAGANAFARDYHRLWVSGGNYYPLVRQFQAQLPEYDDQPSKGISAQVDALASFKTGPVSHRLLYTIDYNSQTDRRVNLRMNAADGANPLYNHLYNLSVDNPDYYFVTYQQNPALYNNPQDNVWTTYDATGFFVSERASLWNDRLIMMLGGRYDTVANRVKDYQNNQFIAYDQRALTHQAGVTFRLTPTVNVYASHSNTFSPQPQFDVNGNPLPNETGAGWEAGLKFSFPAQRLNVTLATYSIDRRNIATTTTVAVPNTNPQLYTKDIILSGHERAQGGELDFNWQATEELQFIGGYGLADAKVLENDDLPYLIGSSPRRVPKHNVGIASRYEFKGTELKGLSLTAGFKYYSESIVNQGSGRTISSASSSNPFINNPMANGTLPYPQYPAGTALTSLPYSVHVTDGRESIYNRPYSLFELGASYRFKALGYKHKLQLNVKNLFNRRYTYGSGIPGDPLQFIGSYTLTF